MLGHGFTQTKIQSDANSFGCACVIPKLTLFAGNFKIVLYYKKRQGQPESHTFLDCSDFVLLLEKIAKKTKQKFNLLIIGIEAKYKS